MALLLAPYNNGMRLGQGFNSYTQQICIDDAVVIDPDRVDNSVTNDGFTMRELRYAIGARRDENADSESEDDEEYLPQPAAAKSTASPVDDASNTSSTAVIVENKPEMGPAPPKILDSMRIQLNQDVQTVTTLVTDIATLEAAIEEATDTDSDLIKRKSLLLEKKRMRLARLKTTGNGLRSADPRKARRQLAQRGPSQIVSYNSRFVNKISEISDDMNISGSLSIKYGSIGGSGKGSFVDSDKFKESDLNFFISVKVVNQSINIKDALVFQGLPSVDDTNFRSVFGDTFISGFMEGGEFNALVSMKVLNKEKRMAIEAEAKIALTVGPTQIDAEAKVGISKANISSQTETTIQVGWSGGGHIKPADQPWTIQTLMETAARFPDLVARTPQRTYAILTKYESLRSFMALKPPALGPMYYENAAIYTNSLLDAYMDYKNIYRTLGTQLENIQADTKKFEPWAVPPVLATSDTLAKIDDESKFAADIKGLDLARRACRFQMIKIVQEVSEIEKKPDCAADEKRGEKFQSPIAFRERLPNVKDKEKMPHLKIFGPETEYPQLLPRTDNDGVTEAESLKAESYKAEQPDVSEFQRLAPMVGSPQGTLFCNLDFIKPDFSLRTISVDVHGGVVSGISLRYANGLLAAMGTAGKGPKVSLVLHPEDGEKIIACSIETGSVKGESKALTRVTAVRLYTNRGPDLLGNAEDWKPPVKGEGIRGGIQFENLTLTHFDPLLVNAHLKGFWGYGLTTSHIQPQSGIYRLAPIWGSKETITATIGDPVDDNVDSSTIITEAEGLVFKARERFGWQGGAPGRKALFEHTFEKPMPIVPTVIYGFRWIDVDGRDSPRVSLALQSVSETGLTLSAKSFLHNTIDLQANAMILPNGKIPFQHGEVDASDNPGGRISKQNATIPVVFSTPFKSPPKVAVWFTEITQPRGARSLKTYISDISETGMLVHIDTWDIREFDSARAAWLAWPSEFDGKTIRSDSNIFQLNQAPFESNWYNGSFSKDPKVFTAIDHIDFPEHPTAYLRMNAMHEGATKDKLRWHAGTWDDTPMRSIGIRWIAIE
ncbi:hypothetical protein N7490_003117 [Penicillium lividum]|nr:hypothetical protein N7490_003117 [Penicillium lividum]